MSSRARAIRSAQTAEAWANFFPPIRPPDFNGSHTTSIPDARHELFNETTRDEVTRDLLAWLDEATGQREYSNRRHPQPTGRRPWA